MGTPVDDSFRQLVQFGAGGTVIAGVLTLAVWLVKRFVDHALVQNTELAKQLVAVQEKTVAALNNVAQAVHDMERAVRDGHVDLGRDIGQLFNEVASITEGTRGREVTGRHRRPRGPGGGSGGGGLLGGG